MACPRPAAVTSPLALCIPTVMCQQSLVSRTPQIIAINKSRRGRCIAPTADVSAIGGGFRYQMYVLKIIIGLRWLSLYPKYFVN
jgi:hypothetical protein